LVLLGLVRFPGLENNICTLFALKKQIWQIIHSSKSVALIDCTQDNMAVKEDTKR